jgi:long-chain fatty acid transport protein
MMLKCDKVLFAALAVLVATQGATRAYASGFALIENSASGQGNAFAGAAAVASDASTIWFNPAGMMHLGNDELVVAGHFIKPNSKFTNNNSTGAAALGSPPLSGTDDDGGFNAITGNFYIVKTLDENAKLGLGITTPFGLATRYDDNWVGRYHGVETDLKTINFNPSIAFKFNEQLSLGAGINLMLADVILTSAVDFGSLCYAFFSPGSCATMGANPQQSDGFADLSGDNFNDFAWGINLGLLYQISPDTRLGLAYRSRVTIDVTGDANFTVPSAGGFATANSLFLDTGLKASVTLPDSLSLSLASEQDKWTWLADLTWTGWGSFKELRIIYDNPAQPNTVTTEEWKNTVRVSAGVNYQYSDAMILRAGWAYDETPIPNAERRTVRIPGNSRRWLSFGVGYVLNKDINLDFGYSHLFVSDTQINNEFESSVPTLAATINGTYEASVDILSAQLSWKY